VQPPPHGEELLLVEALRRLGAHAVEREGERFVALFPPPRDPRLLLRRAEAAIRTATSIREPWLSWRWHPREEWARRWTAELEPRRVGEHLVVTPRDRDPAPLPGDRVIRLVPGLGFGTAEHATTRGCLVLLERCVRPGDRVADVGAGSGILAIAAALLGAREVLALERDPYACEAARANAAENGVAEWITVREVEVEPETLAGDAPFDGVAANLQAEILLPLLPALLRATAPGGWAVVSGLWRAEAGEVRRVAAEAGAHPEAEVEEEGWWAACLRRPNP
jgi:ribosomal protein L11 methyltransferase